MPERGKVLFPNGAVLGGTLVVKDGTVDSDGEIWLSLQVNGREVRSFYVSADELADAPITPDVPLATPADVEKFLEG